MLEDGVDEVYVMYRSPERDIAIRLDTVMAYVKQKRLQKDAKGCWHFTDAMVSEMHAIDQAAGGKPPTEQEAVDIAKAADLLVRGKRSDH